MGEGERERLVGRITGSLAQVGRDDVIEPSMEHFRHADAEYERHIEAGVEQARLSWESA
jgi:catalase